MCVCVCVCVRNEKTYKKNKKIVFLFGFTSYPNNQNLKDCKEKTIKI